MEIRVLKYFLTLCEMGSITSAAHVLNITQPALSRQLISLEEDLGEKLFTRNKHGIILTEAGAYLRKRAFEIVSLSDRTAAEMPHSGRAISGDLHIGAGESPSIAYTVKVFKRLLSFASDIRIHFYNPGSRDIQTSWLENGVIDFALMGVIPLTRNFSNIKLPLQDRWGLLVSKASPLAAKPYITPEDLKEVPLLSGRSENFRSLMSGWLDYDFNQLHLVGSSFLMTSTEQLVKEEIACAIIKEGIMNEGISSDVCFRPFFPEVVSGVYLVWSGNREMTRLHEMFLSEMKMQGDIP